MGGQIKMHLSNNAGSTGRYAFCEDKFTAFVQPL